MDRQDFGCLIRTVLAAPHRHSRVSGNPDGTEKTSPLPPNRRRIPAYAGMTVGAAALYRGDSRLRGKDGGETAAPLSSGFPLTREGRWGDRRPSTVEIPAYAGMTVGAAGRT